MSPFAVETQYVCWAYKLNSYPSTCAGFATDMCKYDCRFSYACFARGWICWRQIRKDFRYRGANIRYGQNRFPGHQQFEVHFPTLVSGMCSDIVQESQIIVDIVWRAPQEQHGVACSFGRSATFVHPHLLVMFPKSEILAEVP